MAETVKKTATKARKAPAKKGASNVESISKTDSGHKSSPSHEQIAELARKYWADGGYKDGHHEEHWHRAEQELRGKAS